MAASFQISGTTPLEKLLLKMDNNSVLAIGLSALRKVGGMSSGPVAPLLLMACMAMSSSRTVKEGYVGVLLKYRQIRERFSRRTFR